MSEIRSAQIVLFYLFDVAETIDLQAIPALIGGPAVAARLAPKPATPAYVQYDKPPQSCEELVAMHGEDIATMLRGERQPLSQQEKTTILSHRISYLVDDLVVPTWNAALVYDTPGGTQATLEIVEFANSQLLEFRYYDELLDDELASIYARLQRPQWFEGWIGARYTGAAPQVHSL